MTIVPHGSLPLSASASSSLQKGVRGGGRNPVIPQPPDPPQAGDIPFTPEESSEESWLGVRLELSLSPLSGSYLKQLRWRRTPQAAGGKDTRPCGRQADRSQWR